LTKFNYFLKLLQILIWFSHFCFPNCCFADKCYYWIDGVTREQIVIDGIIKL